MSNMVINTNVLALNSHRAMKNVGSSQAQASARLSSGLKINSAADDAAGLAISEKMRAQIRGLDMASKNAQDGSSLVQTAEGGMQQIDAMVQRGRELTVQAANDTNTDEDRAKIANEISQLFDEIDSMAGRVEFNGKKLINGDFASTSTGQKLYLQVGANANQSIQFNIGTLDTKGLGFSATTIANIKNGFKSYSATTALIATKAYVTNDTVVDKNGKTITLSGLVANGATIPGTVTPAGYNTFLKGSEIDKLLGEFDKALSQVTDERAKVGAIQNRLDYTIKSLDISSENLSASESRIRDADMAKEMMSLTKSNVLSQAATSMLAQANQQPQNLLQLLR